MPFYSIIIPYRPKSDFLMSQYHRILPATLLTLLIMGCQTTDPYTGESELTKTSKGAGIGALAGAALGALIDGRKGALIGAGVGALGGGAVGNYMDRQEAELRRQLASTGVSVSRNGNDVLLNLPGNITFASGSSELSANFTPVLDSIALVVTKYDQTYIDIVGFTDSTGSNELNDELSRRRAEGVADYLVRRDNVLPERIIAEGRGESNPIATNSTANGRAMNRRVQIQLTPVT